MEYINGIILTLNILGTFLLSVEAIKIENLQKILNSLSKSHSILNPRIDVNVSENNILNRIGCHGFLILVIIIFFPISYYLVSKMMESHISSIWIILISLFGSIVIWTVLIYLIQLLMKFLKLIEDKTSKGSVGIFGFIILVISFSLQYYSTIKHSS